VVSILSQAAENAKKQNYLMFYATEKLIRKKTSIGFLCRLKTYQYKPFCSFSYFVF